MKKQKAESRGRRPEVGGRKPNKLRNVPAREMEMEMLRRAMDRTEKAVHDTKLTLARLHTKQEGQWMEMEKQQFLASAEVRGQRPEIRAPKLTEAEKAVVLGDLVRGGAR